MTQLEAPFKHLTPYSINNHVSGAARHEHGGQADGLLPAVRARWADREVQGQEPGRHPGGGCGIVLEKVPSEGS